VWRLSGCGVKLLSQSGGRVVSKDCDFSMKAYRIPTFNTLYFGGEVKPEVPCYKILRHINNHLKVSTKYFPRRNLSFPSPAPSLLLDDSAGRIARELWWTNPEFYPVDITPPWFPRSYIT
jgi:hypothetical protein